MSTDTQARSAPLHSRFGSTFEALGERLYDSISRGPLLKCFLTKSSASRLDITRFDIDRPCLDPSRKQLLVEYGKKVQRVISSDFSRWSKQLIRDLGEWVSPYLADVWEEVNSQALREDGDATTWLPQDSQ